MTRTWPSFLLISSSTPSRTCRRGRTWRRCTAGRSWTYGCTTRRVGARLVRTLLLNCVLVVLETPFACLLPETNTPLSLPLSPSPRSLPQFCWASWTAWCTALRRRRAPYRGRAWRARGGGAASSAGCCGAQARGVAGWGRRGAAEGKAAVQRRTGGHEWFAVGPEALRDVSYQGSFVPLCVCRRASRPLAPTTPA